MKIFKILTIACLSFIAVAVSSKAQAQTTGKNFTFTSATNASGLDTVTNTGVKTQSLILAGYWDVVTIQVDVTKISGTVGGSLALQGNDGIGTKYVAIDTAITVSDATKSYSFSVNPSKWAKYHIVWTGTGTMAASVTSHGLARIAIPIPKQF